MTDDTRPEVRADRIAIMEYIAQDSPLAAIDLDDEIEDKVDAQPYGSRR